MEVRYYEDPTYCLEDADCAIREGACGPRAMNIYFDNSKLLKMAPYADCLSPITFKNPQCSNNVCIAETDFPDCSLVPEDQKTSCCQNEIGGEEAWFNPETKRCEII